MGRDNSPYFDVFVSYASEDREDFVAPLYEAMKQRGLEVWVDFGQLELGDPIRRKLDDGLVRSRFGVVVLSPHSLEKFWSNLEWDALLALEDAMGSKRILPVLHGITHEELLKKSPILGGRLSAASSEGIAALVTKIANVVQASPTSPGKLATNLYGVPRQQQFVGRTNDLGRVRQAILQGDTTVSASISGLAGIGKTALATELAHQLAIDGEFSGGIFWLDAEEVDLQGAWAGHEIGGLLAAEVPPAERSMETIRRISRMKTSVLIILDNVSSWTSAERPGPLPQGKHVHLLLTTREANLGGSDFKQIPLEVLPEEDARELLLKTAGRDLEPGVEDLLEALQGHALAIELAGAYLSEEGCAADYVHKLDRSSVELEASHRVRYEKTTAMALASIWERLDGDGRQAWCRASCFEPQPVGFELSNAVGVDRLARRVLGRWHLIKTDRERKRWRMHRLVREYGHTRSSEKLRTSALRDFEKGCGLLASEFDHVTGHEGYLAEQAHLEAVLSRKLDETLDIDACLFLYGIGQARYSAGDFAGARELQERVLDVRRQVLGPEHPDTLMAMNNLAATLWALGELESARKLEEQVLEARRRVLGEEHPDTLTSMNNLAGTLHTLNDFEGARILHELALEARRQLLGEEHPDTLTSMNNLAGALRALGDLEGARKLHEPVFEVRRRVLGEEHPHTLNSMNNLALTLRDLGDLEGARKLHEQELETSRRVLGEGHPDTLISMNNLAGTLQALGDLEGARAMVSDALSNAQKSLPEGVRIRVALEQFAARLEN